MREATKNSWEMQTHIIKCNFMRVGMKTVGLK